MRRAQVGLIHGILNQLVRYPRRIERPTHIRFLYLLWHLNVLSQIDTPARWRQNNYHPDAPRQSLAAVALCTRRRSCYLDSLLLSGITYW